MDNSDFDDVDWEDGSGIKDSDIRKENNSCVGQQDPISLNIIEKGDEIKFDNQCYSRQNLKEWLKISNTLPHNRRELMFREFESRDIRGGLNKRNKKSKSRKVKKSKKGRKSKNTRKSKKQRGGTCYGSGVGANNYDPNFSIYNTRELKLFPYKSS